MSELDDLRNEVDAADDEILAALKRRFTVTDRLCALKEREGLPRADKEREREVLARVAAAVPPEKRDTVCAIWERLFAGTRGEIETIARGVCVKDGKVLLCRGKGASSTYLPGGHIEFGETGAEALVREIKEETGLDSTAGKLLGVVENSFLQHGAKHCEINLIYELDLEVRDVAAQEDWIGFEWRAIGDLDAANLLPAEMKGYVKP
ncbi:MAG: chorismate mutase [Kiritimatiellae bacterium]|nr:chorismate mutase [Kiritimatiellia bacterium]